MHLSLLYKAVFFLYKRTAVNLKIFSESYIRLIRKYRKIKESLSKDFLVFV